MKKWLAGEDPSQMLKYNAIDFFDICAKINLSCIRRECTTDDERNRETAGMNRKPRKSRRWAHSRTRRDYSLALTVRGVVSSSDPQEGTGRNVRITPQSTDTSLAETPGHCVSDLVGSTALVRLPRYVGSRFHQVNDRLYILYSDLFENNADYRRQNKYLLVNHRITGAKNHMRYIWIIM
ncbi:hypothetical protein ALC53_01494 [Atta colombica]|uniref:Uncharacterized protein n=1 Tax=Atta colombica TaxID=520822 RepID=A0A195BTJ8_9HYME|nr:hypothetical protein ALC53_01494 [Atta colombica]